MALKRYIIDGYGQLELNQVAFRRDGRVEAQCALDEDDFADIKAENGMLLAIDRVNRVVKLPEAGKDFPIALNYSSEHMYDDRHNALKDFALERGTFYPRLGYLSVGELFTSNCLAYDDTAFDDDKAVDTALEAFKTTAVFGQPCANGAIQLTTTKPASGVGLKVVEVTTMPDGQRGIKFQVISA